jgi:predicted dehydrogenase
MKILAIGGGSMGRRRLRDLGFLNVGEVILFEPVAGRCKEIAAAFGVRGFTDFEEALAQKPDVMTISTPPALHELYVRKAMELGLHVFAEVPFVLDARALTDIAERTRTYPRVLGVSHTIRYYPPFRLIHDVLQRGEIGKPLYLEYSLGNYLPEWHPYEDYRKFYASDIGLGGAGLDMLPHELSAIQWWLGNVQSVLARFSKLSSLEIKGADSHDLLLAFGDGARGFFHHDLIERGTAGRHVRIVGEQGTIEWHQNLPTVRVYRGQKNEELPAEQASDWEAALQASRDVTEALARQAARSGTVRPDSVAAFKYESCYLREMQHFLGAVEGKHPYSMATVAEELQTLRVVHAAVQSDKEKREVAVGR